MGDDGVRRVAILGGGMGALAAAFELSAPELQGRLRVTVYQMGWRLGGKCASARNPERGFRSEEHGLHIWFGFYRNAFGLVRRTYEALRRPESHPFRSVDGVFVPQQQVSFGSSADDGGPWTLSFPARPGAPWDPDEQSPAQVVTFLVEWVLDAVEGWATERAGFLSNPEVNLPRALCLPDLPTRIRDASGKLTRRRDEASVAALRDALADLQRGARDTLVFAALLGPKFRQLWGALDLALAMLSGLLDPSDRVLLEGDLGRIDDWEFRDWLRAHGAWEVNVWAPPVRALYDAAFAYRGGDPRMPAFAAGVAMRVILRIVLDYRGSIFYLPRAGFGEVVVQPLYELLSRRGVRFEFFHRVDRLEADAGLTRVERVKLTRQAKTVGDAAYEPLIRVQVPRPGGATETFDAWPPTPDWTQLVDGKAMKAAGVDFESRWGGRKKFPGAPLVLERGKHFDDVVLGIPLHAAGEVLKPFAAHPVLGPALHKITAVPTVSAQVWLDAPTGDLVRTNPTSVVGAPPPLDIWSDMTQVMDYEPWPVDAKPRSLHYLCAVAPLAKYVSADPSDVGVPGRAREVAEHALQSFLADASWAIWPDLVRRGAGFDWNLLHDPAMGSGVARLGAQYARANVDPTECCPTSLPGAIGARPTAGTSGVENLFLASDSLRTGLDTSCVESAVMAGRQAARALAGWPYRVPGEDFLARLPADPPRAVVARGTAGPPPKYVDWLGLGQMSIPSAVVFQGCTAWVALLEASRAQLQELVDQKLNAPSRNALRFRVPFGAVGLTFLHGDKGFDTTQAIGNVQDNEMTFGMLLTYERNGLTYPAFWMPYIAVDTAIAMASGRETWGFPKECGEVEPPQGEASIDAQSSVLYFTTLDNATEGIFGPIVKLVEARGGFGPIVKLVDDRDGDENPMIALSSVAMWLDALVEFLLSLDPANIFDFDFASLTSLTDIPIVNLKQFRDVEDDTFACYQAIDLTSFQLSNIGGLGVVKSGVHCEITPAESHDFVNTFGLSGASVQVPLTLKSSFDFTVSGGKILWQAPKAGTDSGSPLPKPRPLRRQPRTRRR